MEKKPLGLLTINMVDGNGISLNSKTIDDFNELQEWHNGKGEETKVFEKGLSVHSLARKYVIRITFSLYVD